MPHRNQEQSTHSSITVESPFFFIRLYIFPRKGATRSSHSRPALACMHLIPMTDWTIWSRLLLHFAIAKMHVVSFELLSVFFTLYTRVWDILLLLLSSFSLLVIVVTHCCCVLWRRSARSPYIKWTVHVYTHSDLIFVPEFVNTGLFAELFQ